MLSITKRRTVSGNSAEGRATKRWDDFSQKETKVRKGWIVRKRACWLISKRADGY